MIILRQKEYGLGDWWRERKRQRAKWTGQDERNVGFWTMINPFSQARESIRRFFHPIENVKDSWKAGKALFGFGQQNQNQEYDNT